MKPIGIQLSLGGEREVESGLRRVGGAMDSVGAAASGLARAVGGVAGAFAGVVSIREFVQAADAVTSLQNQLKLATGSAQAAGTAYNELFAIAQRSRTGFVELGQTFASISTAAADLGVSQQRLLTVTEAIGNAVTISGTGAQAAQAALQQLGQGLASGTLRGEELNSVMEQTPRLAKALADGLGVTRGELRALGQQGAITAEQVIKALEAQSSVLQGEVKDATMTVGQAFTQFKNEAVLSVGAIDKAAGSTALLAQTISDVSGAIGELRNTEAFMDALTLVGQTVTVLFNDVAFVLKGIGREIGGIAAQAAAVARLDFSGAAAIRAAMVSDAKAARAELDAREVKILTPRTTVQADPNDPRNAYNNFTSRSQSFANAPREQAAAEKELLAIRQKLYGVDKDYIPTLEKLNQQYQSGRLTLAEYTGLVERLANANFKKPSAGQKEQGGNPYAAQQDAAKAWAKTMMDAEKGVVDLEEKTQGLNQAQGVLLEYISSPAYAANSEEMRQAALARLYVWDAAIKNADGIKAEKEAMEQASKAMAAWFDVRARDADALKSQVQARREEVDAMGLSADAVARLSAAKYEQAAAEQEAYAAALKSAKLYAGEYAQAYDAAAQDALDQAKRLRELGTLDIAKGQKQAALDAETEWKRTADTINQSLTDALLRGFESGKDFAKNLRDTVVNMFKTMVLRPVISAIINPISGAITGMMGLSGAAQAGQGASALGGIGNMASLASGIGSFTTAGMLPAGLATALTGSTSSLAMGLSGAWGAGGGMLSTLNAGASMLGSGSIMSGLGTLAGALGPIALGIAALAAIFGKKATPHAGAASTYSEAGGLVSGADIYRASGLADVRTYNAGVEQVTGNVAKAIGDTLNATARTFGKTAGYEITTAFADDKSKDGAWGSLMIRRGGESVIDWRDTQTSKWAPKEFADGEAGSKEYLAAVAKSARDALVQAIGSVDWATDMLKGLGESVSLESLAQTVQQINAAKAAFVGFGQYMPAFASLADSAVSKLVQASGGVDALAGNMSIFVDGFYTDAEKLAINTENVRAAMERLGFEMPATRDEFKALVQAQIALGDAGAKTAAGLLGLSGAFASVTQSAEEAAAMARASAEKARGNALSALQRAVDAEKRLLDTRIDVASGAVSDLSGLFGLMHDNVRDLYGEVSSTAAMMAAQGQDFITQALTAARTTGYMPDQEQLAEAIGAARSGIGAAQYATQFEADRDRLVLAGQLSELEGLTGEQLGTAERTLKELQGQSDQLDQTMDYWRDQIELSQAGVDATLSVADAVASLQALMFPGATPAGAKPTSAASGGVVFGGTSPTGMPTVSSTVDEVGLRTYADGSTYQMTPEEYYVYMLWRSGKSPMAGHAGIPAFAVGTNYVPHDMTARIHEGEAIVPKAYNPWAGGGAGMGGNTARLEALVETLTLRVEGLQSELSAIRGHTAGLPVMVDQFDSVTEGGNAMRGDSVGVLEI